MSLVNRIKEECKKQKTNIAALEKELEIGNGVIRRWDERNPNAYQVLKIANRLNVTIDWLLTGKEAGDLTPDEAKLVDLYKTSSSTGREIILENAEATQKRFPADPEDHQRVSSSKTG